MITSILLLAVVFLAGLLTTNLPSKFFAMFISIISVKNSSSSSSSQPPPPPDVVITTKTTAAGSGGGGNVVKKSVSCSNKEELKRVFATFDKNGDGTITKQELRESLKNMGMVVNEKDVEDLIWTVDTNEDGLIDLDEFCESFACLVSSSTGDHDHERNGSSSSEEEGKLDGDRELKEAFDVFDEDKDGVITVEELGLVLSNMGFGQGNRLEECTKMIKKVDMDGDGNVNFQEFKKMMKHGPHGFLPLA